MPRQCRAPWIMWG